MSQLLPDYIRPTGLPRTRPMAHALLHFRAASAVAVCVLPRPSPPDPSCYGHAKAGTCDCVTWPVQAVGDTSHDNEGRVQQACCLEQHKGNWARVRSIPANVSPQFTLQQPGGGPRDASVAAREAEVELGELGVVHNAELGSIPQVRVGISEARKSETASKRVCQPRRVGGT